jgi:branched-subunit amino acid transport protein
VLRRFGLRRILPFAQLALFIALVTQGFLDRRQQFEQRQIQPVSFQESIPFEPATDLPLPAPWVIAIVLNVPAAVLGALVAEAAHVGTNLGALICSTPFVLILWHFLGRWSDRQLGFLPMKVPGNLARILCACGIGLAAAFFAVGIIAFKAPTLTAGSGSATAMAIAWLLWSLALFLMCLFTLRRRHASTTIGAG